MSVHNGDLDEARPAAPQPRAPRRASTLPVRFDSSVARPLDEFAGRRRRRVYQAPRQRPLYGHSPTRERRRSPPDPHRYQTYYEDEEIDGARESDPAILRERERESSSPTPVVPRERVRGDYDAEDELDIRVRRGQHSPLPAPYARVYDASYEDPRISRGSRSRDHGASSYYDDEDDLDIRILRGRASPVPGIYPEHRHRPIPRPYAEHSNSYLAPAISASRTRSSGPVPIIINNRIYNDYEDDDNLALAPPGRSPDLDFDVITQAYSFSLSRYSKSSLGSESVSGSISDSSEKDDGQEQAPLKKDSGSGKTYHILRSQYVGDGMIGGRHAVQLTVIPELDPNPRKGLSPIFKWMSVFQSFDCRSATDFSQTL